MTVPMIPDSAPFTPAQRAWLNGFLAGVLGDDRADAAPSERPMGSAAVRQATATAGDPPAEVGSWRDVEDEDFDQYPWHDPDLSLDERLEMVRGKPLDLRLMGAMAQLDCGQCGYLCRTYAKAIETGEETNLKRCIPGGKATARAIRKLLADSEKPGNGRGGAMQEAESPPSAPPQGQPGSALAAPVVHDRDHPFPAPTLAVRKLTAAGSDKDTRFVSLSLAGSGLSYRVGDSLGVYPKNCYEQVEALVRLLGVGGGEPVGLPDGRRTTFREALIEHRDINNPSDELYELLAGCATERREAEDLSRALAAEPVEGLIDEPRVIDVLARFPSARPAPPDLIAALDALQPRLYSISSSPKLHPEEVHLTVGVVRYERQGRPHKGVASTFLADRILNHEPVRIFVQPSHAFTLTDAHEAPLIMIGPGTGIAPFRAFLQERRAIGATGRNWLFFGERRAATDFLYERELRRYREEGLLSRLSTAFSRDQPRRIYVQHRMLEEAAELWTWLRDGAYFYVCGDAGRMAGDVDRALRRIVAEQGRMSEDSAADYIARMKQAGRYQRDVY